MKNLLTIIFSFLFLVVFIALTFLFIQFLPLKQGYWGKICSWDEVENGKVKSMSAIVFMDEKHKCPNSSKTIKVWMQR